MKAAHRWPTAHPAELGVYAGITDTDRRGSPGRPKENR